MPLYEYECERCGHLFEVIQKFSDQPIDKCPKCGGPVHKLQSAPAFQFKGSGWYITDYARKDQSGSGKTDSSSTAPAAEKKEGGGEQSAAAPKTEKPADKSTSSDSAPPAKKD
jgi:putative FmdB family regulatory protein